MLWRKWLVRGMVFSLTGCLVAGALLYQRITDPVMVREQVVAQLNREFPGGEVLLEAARLSIFGGIVVTDLRLVRRDDSTRVDLAYVPSGVIYHDKEQLLDGKITIRKVELHRPRVRLVRAKDGTWNFHGLTRPSDSASDKPQQLPTIVVQEGTLHIEDHSGKTAPPPLAIHAVSLTLINDPINTVNIEGQGTSETLGKVQIHASLRRDTSLLTLDLKVNGLSVSTGLIEHVLWTCAQQEPPADLDIHGKADLHVVATYQPAAKEPLSYDVLCKLYQGTLRHSQLPDPLQNLQLEARCQDGKLLVEKAVASMGQAQLEAEICSAFPEVCQHWKAAVTLHKLQCSPEISQRFPENVQFLYRLYQPSGPVTLQFELEKRGDDWLRQRVVLTPEKLRLFYSQFPYPVDEVTGIIDADLLKHNVSTQLAGKLSGQPVSLSGSWHGVGNNAEADFDLKARGVPIDEKLMAALAPELQKLARSFNPTGLVDLEARFYRQPLREFRNEFHVHLRDATMRWDQFPYPLEQVSGYLDIYANHWEFRDFRGRHGKGEVMVSGRSFPPNRKHDPKAEARMWLDICGSNLAIDNDMRSALGAMPWLARTWDTFHPGGQLSFRSIVDRVPGQSQDLDLDLEVHGCSLKPEFFPYALQDMGGRFRYRKNRLELEQVVAKHGRSELSIERGIVDISAGGGFFADLQNVRGNPIYPDVAFLSALPPQVRNTLQALQLKDPVAMQMRMVIARGEDPGSRPDVYWDGQLWMRDAKLNLGVEVGKVTGTVACVGRHNGQQIVGVQGNILLDNATVLQQPLRNVHAKLAIRDGAPDVMHLTLNAPYFGGTISGQARVDFNSTLRYELNMTAAEIDLGKFGQHNLDKNTQMSGQASARLHLMGQGDNMDTLDGNGTIDVPFGRFYNLPLLLDLLKFLGLRWPDRTAFEEAHASYSIRGKRLYMERLDLWGNAISMSGHGEVNIDGSDVHLDFYPTWARMEQLLPPALRSFGPSVGKNLLKVEMRGKLGGRPEELKLNKRPVPMLVDPLLQMRDRMARSPVLRARTPQAANLAQPIQK